MKNRYILLILFSLFALYMVWCNISFIYTRENKSNIILVDKISYPKDSFNTESATVFWQGFYHDWGYNHRVNRMGDWIQSIQKSDNGIQAVISHSAAAGSGSDVLDYQTFFTYVKSQKAKFFSSIVSCTVRGREATTTTKMVTVKGAWPNELKNYKQGIVVLNGFDLASSTRSNGKVMGSGNADKLSMFYINVQDLKIENDSFSFNLTIKLGADCDSPECINFTPGDNEWFDYQFRVAYQIMTYNEGVHIASSKVSQNYNWWKPLKTRPDIDPNEIFRNDKTFKNKNINGIAGYNIGIPVFDKIEVNIEKGNGGFTRKRKETPHLLMLDIAIPKYTYNASSGSCVYDIDLFFKNWKPNMHPLSFGNDGTVTINAGLKLIQISDPSAIAEDLWLNGKINWQTTQLDQRESDDPSAVKSFVFNK